MFPSAPIRLSRAAIGLSALAILSAGTAAFAQATYDIQVPFNLTTFAPALISPGGVAVAADGTVYVTDVKTTTTTDREGTTTSYSDGRVIRIEPSGTVGGNPGKAGSLSTTSVAKLALTGATLKYPNAVVVDSLGYLYIADFAAPAVYKVADPETTGTVTKLTYPGSGPTALATDAANDLFVADSNGSIYKFTGSATTGAATTGATTLGIGTGYIPVGLAVNSAGDVIFANAKAGNDKLYEYSTATGVTPYTPSSAITFDFTAATVGLPIGMGFDPSGSLYVLDNGSGDLWQINAALPDNPYQLPFSAATTTPGSLAVSSIGNLYISDDSATTGADELFYNNNPVNLGAILAGTNSPLLNQNFNVYTKDTPITGYQTVQGDFTGEFSYPTNTGTCNGDVGVCHLQIETSYQGSTPGLRNGVVGYIDGFKNIFASHVVGISGAASLALYPGTQAAALSTTFSEPQGLAVSGDDQTFFVVDEGGINLNSANPTYPNPAVYIFPIANGVPTGTPKTLEFLGSNPYPDAVTLDGFGNLYIADYSGHVTVFPPTYNTTDGATTWVGPGTQLTLPASAALTHPMSLTVDIYNNLYIGDMGPGGTSATSANPGYIIKVPGIGTPQNTVVASGIPITGAPDGALATRLNYVIGTTPVIFPDGLTTDSFGNLFIADAGDGIVSDGNVDVVPIATISPTSPAGQASTLSTGGAGALNEPAAVGFDAANDLYVLDAYNQRILTIPFTYSGSTPVENSSGITLLGGGNSGLSTVVTPSSLVVWPNQNTLSVADIGYEPSSGAASPVQVLTLASQNTSLSIPTAHGSASLAGINVGNEPITFGEPHISNGNFSLSDCGTDGFKLATGVTNACTATVTDNASGTGLTATVTLTASATADGSALGNVITVAGPPVAPVPIAQISPTSATSTNSTGTITVENIGGGTLVISGIVPVAGSTTVGANACVTGTSLENYASTGQSCTITYVVPTPSPTQPPCNGLQFGECTVSNTMTVTVNSNGTDGTASLTGTYTYQVTNICIFVCFATDVPAKGGTPLALTPGTSNHATAGTNPLTDLNVPPSKGSGAVSNAVDGGANDSTRSGAHNAARGGPSDANRSGPNF